MDTLEGLSLGARLLLYALLTLMGVFSCLVLWAQVRCISGRFFENPDGTKDDWTEQKVFFGMAWADILIACPTSFAGLILIFTAPRWGFFLMGMVGFWFLWANVMTTVTSLRFERPRLTTQWILVFPLGAVIGLAFIVWTLVHFNAVFGV